MVQGHILPYTTHTRPPSQERGMIAPEAQSPSELLWSTGVLTWHQYKRLPQIFTSHKRSQTVNQRCGLETEEYSGIFLCYYLSSWLNFFSHTIRILYVRHTYHCMKEKINMHCTWHWAAASEANQVMILSDGCGMVITMVSMHLYLQERESDKNTGLLLLLNVCKSRLFMPCLWACVEDRTQHVK